MHDLASVIKDIQADSERLYKHFHQNPELSMLETKTVETIVDELESYGYSVQQIGGGVVGVLENGDGETILFRADIDGLPVKEETGLEYASTKTQQDAEGVMQPVMHACGHDFHIAAGLGAARILAENRDAWTGTYIALFQPGEETAEGATSMVEDGLADKIPTPSVALGQHVLTDPVAGKVAVAAGPVLSTGASIAVKVFGVGTHSSMPHLGIDPVVLASTIVVRLQTIIARELAPNEFGVVTVGSVQAGTKANIIPDSATLQINVRAYSDETRKQLIKAVDRIVRAECAASASPREPEIIDYDEYPLTDNDAVVAESVRKSFINQFGEDRVEVFVPATASEDFSNIPRAFGIPYCYWGVGGFTEDQEVYANHNPKFAPALQPTLQTAIEAATSAALGFLGKPR